MAHVPQVHCTGQRFALVEWLVVDCAWGVAPPILYTLYATGFDSVLAVW